MCRLRLHVLFDIQQFSFLWQNKNRAKKQRQPGKAAAAAAVGKTTRAVEQFSFIFGCTESKMFLQNLGNKNYNGFTFDMKMSALR